MVQAVERQFEPVRYAEFVVDLAQVVLDDLLGRTQLIGNFFIALALRNASNDGHLLGRKPRLALRTGERGRLRAVSLDHPVHRLVVDPGFTLGDLADTLDQQVWRNGPRNDAAHPATIELDRVLFVRGDS